MVSQSHAVAVVVSTVMQPLWCTESLIGSGEAGSEMEIEKHDREIYVREKESYYLILIWLILKFTV